MDPKVPSRVNPTMPDVFHGEIYRSVGKYARGAVLFAFEEMGGPQALADWGEKNPDDFYTKLFPKIIARESEVQHVRGVDDLMDLLDANYEVVGDDGIEDAEVVGVDEAMERGDLPREDWDAEEVQFGWTDDSWDLDDMVDFPDD